MKKLILNLSFPCTFLLMSFSGSTTVYANVANEKEIIVPAVIYNGETIPVVNLPVMIISDSKYNIKADNERPNKKKPIIKRPGIKATT